MSTVRASAGEPPLCAECRPEVKVAEEKLDYSAARAFLMKEFCPPVQPPKAAEENYWRKLPWISKVHYEHLPLPFTIIPNPVLAPPGNPIDSHVMKALSQISWDENLRTQHMINALLLDPQPLLVGL